MNWRTLPLIKNCGAKRLNSASIPYYKKVGSNSRLGLAFLLDISLILFCFLILKHIFANRHKQKQYDDYL